MTIQDLGALGELIGSVAVLATLIYLTLQTRQNTMAITAQLDAARISAVQNHLLAPVISPELCETLAHDMRDGDSGELRREQYFFTSMITSQWQWLQRGQLLTFKEEGIGRWISRMFQEYGSFPDWWEGTKSIFAPDFIEWVEEQRAKAA